MADRTCADRLPMTRPHQPAEMTIPNDESNSDDQVTKEGPQNSSRDSDFVIPWSFSEGLISTRKRLTKLISHIDRHDPLAVVTDADSRHCYREKLCPLQVSLPAGDFLDNPLA